MTTARPNHQTTPAVGQGAGLGVDRSWTAGSGRQPRWDPGFAHPASNRDGDHDVDVRPDGEHGGEQGRDRVGQAAVDAARTQQVEPRADPSAPPHADEPAPDGGLGADPLGLEAGARSTGAGGSEGALSSARLLRPVRPVPRSGWRAALYTATGGWWNPGESTADRARRELGERVGQRLGGCYRVASVSVKGGVGKTSTTALLGSTFASLRGDRVVAVDANPDRGNLAEKVRRETQATVRHLLGDAEQIRTAADVRAYTSQAASRLEVIASESDPAMSEAYNAADYQATVDLLSRHYNILLTDNGTGLMHQALTASLEVADSLLIVTTPSIDGARAAQATVDWLEAHGHRELVARSVTVINGVRRRANVDLDAVERHFRAHTRAVVQIPWDRHLDDGAEIDLNQLSRATRDAMLHLAATVADDFARPGRHHGGARRRTPAVHTTTGHTTQSAARAS